MDKKEIIKALNRYKNKCYKDNNLIAYAYIKNCVLTLKGLTSNEKR